MPRPRSQSPLSVDVLPPFATEQDVRHAERFLISLHMTVESLTRLDPLAAFFARLGAAYRDTQGRASPQAPRPIRSPPPAPATVTAAPKRRGRPPKALTPNGSTPQPKRRGRPPRSPPVVP